VLFYRQHSDEFRGAIYELTTAGNKFSNATKTSHVSEDVLKAQSLAFSASLRTPTTMSARHTKSVITQFYRAVSRNDTCGSSAGTMALRRR